MNKKILFKNLSMKEKSLTHNCGFADLMLSGLDAIFQTENCPLGMVQKHYLMTEVAHCYQHFGFTLFSPAARTLLLPQLENLSGVANDVLLKWLEYVCFLILEDFNILRLVEGEPDWSSVDAAFFHDFSRRIISSERNEIEELALDCWDSQILERLQSVAELGISFLRNHGLEGLLAYVKSVVKNMPFAEEVAKAFFGCFEEIFTNPMCLLVWRVQCFSSFTESRHEAHFFVREMNEVLERKAYGIAALLSLFLPHKAPNGALLLPQTPVTLSQLKDALKSNSSTGWFDCSVLTALLDLGKTNESELNVLLEQAKSMKYVFEVPVSKHKKGYGLTKPALKILAPFQAVISEVILSARPEEAALGDASSGPESPSWISPKSDHAAESVSPMQSCKTSV